MAILVFAGMFAAESRCFAQASGNSPAATVWSALSAGAMDPGKFAHAENVEIVRDRVHITLTDGTIQFTQPANGVVFGAVFHGKGRLHAEPPNPMEAQQLRLFTKQDKLDFVFGDATFSFTDGLLEEVAKQVKWQTSQAPADDLYAKRLKEREDLPPGKHLVRGPDSHSVLPCGHEGRQGLGGSAR